MGIYTDYADLDFYETKQDPDLVIENLLQEFKVNDENQLLNKLSEESETIPCVQCKQEFPPDMLNFDTDDPLCFNCLNKGH
jgi:hypothetical protein